ncbi:Long-chain-fatty-acid--CoA ligase [Planctomycetes bacterium Pan216]|uniref:Long-chain-fatty-acid--CoA ligase n=1 Tax=Kolteria novifilia TaxID=2527975 RepID=A0A518B6H0_9BACT|nr:Long-chain-fatty-acid--CoA ligase [Planctomycetes bacterium Pan216]
MKIDRLLDDALGQFPEKPALIYRDRSWSFSSLDDISRRLAGGLVNLGIRPGDRIAIFTPNCPELLFTYLACLKLGAIAVPLNYRYQLPGVRFALEHSQASLVVAHEDLVDRLPPRLPGIAPKGYYVTGDTSYPSFLELLAARPFERTAFEASEPAIILYTSGSTGSPKGVLHSRGSLSAVIEATVQLEDVKPDDVSLVRSPCCHAAGLLTQLTTELSVGATSVLAMRSPPQETVELMRRHRVTRTRMAAADLTDFVRYATEHAVRLPYLRVCMAGGDTHSIETLRHFEEHFGFLPTQGIAMTELPVPCVCNPVNGPQKIGSLGLPLPGAEVRLVDDHDQDIAPGSVGEIVLRHPAMCVGYWRNPDATDELFSHGWLHMGDLAREDEEGYLWFVGRKKLIIVRRGSNIAPIEVEQVLNAHPKVYDSVVVGAPHPSEGQCPVAYVAPHDPLDPPTEDELRDFVGERLAAYKVPVLIFLLTDLPKSGTGKHDRRLLTRHIAQVLGDGSDSRVSVPDIIIGV